MEKNIQLLSNLHHIIIIMHKPVKLTKKAYGEVCSASLYLLYCSELYAPTLSEIPYSSGYRCT